MKSCCSSIIRRVLVFAVMALLGVALAGCNDPVVSNMEAEHERLGRVCQQELQRGGYVSPRTAQAETLFPAP